MWKQQHALRNLLLCSANQDRHTFAATAEVVRYLDAKPVLMDVRADDLNMNPDLIEAAITERTRAIIPVHIAGLWANRRLPRETAVTNAFAVDLLACVQA